MKFERLLYSDYYFKWSAIISTIINTNNTIISNVIVINTNQPYRLNLLVPIY